MFIFVSLIWLNFTASVASEIRLSSNTPDGDLLLDFRPHILWCGIRKQ